MRDGLACALWGNASTIKIGPKVLDSRPVRHGDLSHL